MVRQKVLFEMLMENGLWVFISILISHTLSMRNCMWGIIEGLRIVWSYGLERIQCQIDCAEAFKLISSKNSHNSPIRLVREITSMASKVWVADFIHIHCETNYVADSIAKMPPNLDSFTSSDCFAEHC
ncbi:hypothetical protein V6N11_070801 [Hibiscus sabdariffa]|uniref:RNase H type-1 domain-containing protein n=1 Tax=Hibiscus sabdariffa TaxID=183260 RepID=A0ABR2QG24_9ROSI